MKKKINTRIVPSKEDHEEKKKWAQRRAELTLPQFVAGASGDKVNIDLTDEYVQALVDRYRDLHPEVASDMEAATAIYLEECKRRGWW